MNREAYVKNHIQRRIGELEGEKSFSFEYRSAHGLLALSNELHRSSSFPESVDFIRIVYEILSNSNILSESGFKSLKWVPFLGTQTEFYALMHSFFNEEKLLRRDENNQLIFIMDENSGIPISGEKGFSQFVNRVFRRNRSIASLYAVAALSEKNFQQLGWNSLLPLGNYLRGSRSSIWFEAVESNRQFKNKEKGELKNVKGEVAEALITENTFENFKRFFQEREFHISTSENAITRNVDSSIPMETLESLGQQNLLFFKENEKKEIKFDEHKFLGALAYIVSLVKIL